MSTKRPVAAWGALGAAVALLVACSPGSRRVEGQAATLQIQHPLAGAILPANMPAPLVSWTTNQQEANYWTAAFLTGTNRFSFEGIRPGWRPPENQWRRLKEAAAVSGPIQLSIDGFKQAGPAKAIAKAEVEFTVAAESMPSPLFFREVNLPFSEAVKDPSKIRWRFGVLDSGEPPPIVLEHLPVCGNCHSFSRKGEYLAMDVDYANNKASYVITRTAPEMRLATSDIITWDEYRREEGQPTFGLLSQISPDGRYVLSTVKDRSVFVARPDLAFSQLFFPLKGILCVYDRELKKYAALPGADDPALVQSNPTWSPDGKWVVFARAQAAELKHVQDVGRVLLTPEECEDFLKRGKQFQFDLFRVPFNEGKGGRPEPLRGASFNGRSNYFPKYSPDGKWIVFCQASNYMLLQPDSELYIIPAAGGEARRLGCNLSRMNSWHSWSPDGRWLVFSSKAHSDYTQLYLSRINDAGQASPPVWLAHMVAPERAANIPEIVDLPPGYITSIREQFLDDYSYVRAGNEFFRVGEVEPALEKYRRALELNPDNALAHQRMGFLLFRVKNQLPEAMQHMQAAVRLDPKNPFARFDFGSALVSVGDLSNGVVHLGEAVRLLPNGFDRQYDAIEMNYTLGEAYYRLERFADAVPVLEAALRRQSTHARGNYLMAMARAWLGETDSTRRYHEAAIKADPELEKLPDYYELLSRNYYDKNQLKLACEAAEKGCQLAVQAGRADQAARLKQRADACCAKR